MNREQFQTYIERDPGAKLRDVVTRLLYDEIVSLRIAPGTKLNVNSLASVLGISRTPVAEAIKKRDSVKGQSFTTCMITFGCILASYFGGLMLDTVGTEITLTVGVLAAAAGAAFVFPGVKGT